MSALSAQIARKPYHKIDNYLLDDQKKTTAIGKES